MKKLELLENIHQRSFLCMIGAFRDLLEYGGHRYSYSFCFGIASEMGFCYGHREEKGADFSYMAAPSYSIQHSVYNMCRVTNVWTETGRTQDKEKLKNIIKKYVDENMPVLLEVESSTFFGALHIPVFTVNQSFKSAVKIGGHNVLVIGYDEQQQTFTLIEALLQKSITLPMETLLDSCVIKNCLMAPEGKWTVFYVPPELPEEKYMVYQSLVHTASEMRACYRGNHGLLYGMEGMERFFATFEDWPELMSQEELVRNLTILYDFERMGQGGGFFRSTFSQFLKEESESLGIEKLKEIAGRYYRLGNLWSQFAEKIRYLVNNPTTQAFRDTLADKELQKQILDNEYCALDDLDMLLNM